MLKDHSIARALMRKRNVMAAVILRDMRTRFFNHGLGFLVVPLWPLTHMIALILIHSFAGSAVPPYGTSAALYYAAGLVPTLTFMYVSRFMALSLVMNRPMLSFPEIQAVDVMLARAFLEVMAACFMLFLIMAILWVSGINPWPDNLESAVYAYLATILLGLGFGMIVGIASMFQPMVVTVYALIIICVYISSGALFVVPYFPEEIKFALSFNPVFQCVEWMRHSFYENYPDELIDPWYVLAWGGCTLCMGLGTERFFRRQMKDL